MESSLSPTYMDAVYSDEEDAPSSVSQKPPSLSHANSSFGLSRTSTNVLLTPQDPRDFSGGLADFPRPHTPIMGSMRLPVTKAKPLSSRFYIGGLLLISIGLLTLAGLIHFLTHPLNFHCFHLSQFTTNTITVIVLGVQFLPMFSHNVAGYLKDDYAFWQPFRGGTRYVFMQALAWTFYGMSCSGVLYLGYMGVKGVSEHVIRAIGVTGAISQLLIIISVPYFIKDKSLGNLPLPSKVNLESTSIFVRLWLSLRNRRKGLHLAGWIQTTVSATSLVQAIVLETQLWQASKSIVFNLSALVTVFALLTAPVYHVLFGPLMHNTKQEGYRYRLFQPCQGGFFFVLMQAFGWCAWSLASCLTIGLQYVQNHPEAKQEVLFFFQDYPTITNIVTTATAHHKHVHILPLTVGTIAVISQVLLLASQAYFSTDKVSPPSSPTAVTAEATITKPLSNVPTLLSPNMLQPYIDTLIVGQLYHAPVYGATVLMVPPYLLLFVFATSSFYFYMVLALYVAYFTPFFFSNAHISGALSWTTFRDPNFILWRALLRYFKAKVAVPSVVDIADVYSTTVTSLRLLASGVPITNYAGITLGYSTDQPSAPVLPALPDAFECQNGELEHYPVPPPELMELLQSVATQLPARQAPFMFCMHPHGIYPMTCFWSTKHDNFVRTFSWQCSISHQVRITPPNIQEDSIFDSPPISPISYLRDHSQELLANVTFVQPKVPELLATHAKHCKIDTTTYGVPVQRNPGELVDVLGASAIHKCAVLRDIFLWCGGRDVSKASILNCFLQSKSCLLVVGGQKEMSYSRFHDRNFVLYTKHKGFVRLALQSGAPLTPLFSFGENQMLNSLEWPALQQLLYKYTRIFLPLQPHGKWFTATPNEINVNVAYGTPLYLPIIANPSEEIVSFFHSLYYAKVRDLFFQYREEMGYGDSKLTYV